MATHEPDIQELRNLLQLSRWQIHDTIHQVEEQLNVSRRIRTEVAEHPLKWVAVALGVGVVATKAVPLLLKVGSKRWLRQLVTSGVRLAAVAALPMLAQAKGGNLSSFFEAGRG